GVVAFSTIGFIVLIVGFAIAYRPTVRSGAIATVCTIGAVGLVAGGAVTGLEGERDMERHETTGMLAEHGECSTTDETHADKNASQTVASKASVAATITLDSEGRLTAAVDGLGDGLEKISIPKSNPSNVIFENESGDDRRLVLELGEPESGGEGETAGTSADEGAGAEEATDGDTSGAGGGSDESGSGQGAAEGEHRQLCTALVEDGGSQL